MKSNQGIRSDLVTVVLCVIVLFMTLGAAGTYSRHLGWRMQCQSHLSTLGKAAIIYSNDYDDALPKAGGRTNEWVDYIWWVAPVRPIAYSIVADSGKGRTTVTSNLYLLVKYAEIVPGVFLCPSDPNVTVFDLKSLLGTAAPTNTELVDVWDFGPWRDVNDNPSRHCSYAYHVPFGNHSLTVDSDPAMAVLADRNPWMNETRAADPQLGWDAFMPGNSPDPNVLRPGNSDTHQGDGQNVLFLDTAVKFEQTPTCGVDRDNIYTSASNDTEAGRQKGRRPVVYQYQDGDIQSARDSYLVQEYGRKAR